MPPTESCETKCQHSCQGALKAELSVDCQADCQAKGFVDCEARLDGGCKLDCESSEGALFCDGQWVDHDNNLDQCIDALKNLGGMVEIKASGEVSVGCSVAEPAGALPGWGALPLIRPVRRPDPRTSAPQKVVGTPPLSPPLPGAYQSPSSSAKSRLSPTKICPIR